MKFILLHNFQHHYSSVTETFNGSFRNLHQTSEFQCKHWSIKCSPESRPQLSILRLHQHDLSRLESSTLIEMQICTASFRSCSWWSKILSSFANLNSLISRKLFMQISTDCTLLIFLTILQFSSQSAAVNKRIQLIFCVHAAHLN